ncbi:hypothetical protein Ahy_B09g095726 isoform D [Arachis hypogaea]|uniref:Uncharacterized protein n=1 Tax=Arachis hypogaea TaxID=3818 RepID=A0A444XG45_ARAHY|nr:hypothetical protein Ahy_B09g095726 isoform D [Arachis hypogaea]
MYNEVRKQRGLQGGDKDYLLFGDVLAFDATYGRNKYNLPVVVFSGVNHHNQTCVFATAMVSCESHESYIWVLEKFLECMQGKAPQSVITDGDPAMRIAIQSVFPDAHHRCESLHAKLGQFVKSRYGILEFVTNFQRCVDFLRDNIDELEFRSWYGTPVLQTEFVELEKSAWTKFTREMFARFRESLKRCVRVRICEINETLHLHVYTLQKYRRPEMTWQVYREPTSNIFSCTCMRMESFGIPCVHIVAVCVRLDLAEIPESLVLRRWSKTAKMEINNKMVDHHTADQSVTYRTRLGAFSQLCKRLGKVACMSDDDFKVYSKKVLSDAVFLEIKYGLRPPNNISTPATDNIVKDPIRVRTKGTGPCSQAGGSAAKTKRKCSTCGKLGHRRTRCPNRDTPTATTNVTATARGHKRKRSKVIYNLNLQSFHIMQLTTLKLMLWC